MKKLSELNVEFVGGQILSRLQIHPEKGDIAVDKQRRTIVAKTISGGLIDEENIICNDYCAMPDEKRLTREGDIVVKMSAPYNAVMIDKEHEGMLVSSFCSIIRNVEEIDKRYLVAFLNSRVAQERLKASVSFAVMSILSNGRLADLEIPTPAHQKQEEIGKYYEKTVINRVLLAKIKKLEEEKLEAIMVGLED